LKNSIIIVFIFHIALALGQSKYTKKWNNLPEDWKLHFEKDENFSENEIFYKYIFTKDSLNLSSSDISDFEYLKLFKTPLYLDLSKTEINTISVLNDLAFEKINLNNTNISQTKITEFLYGYKRGENIYSTQKTEIIVEYNFYPKELDVTREDFIWWQNLTSKWKLLIERNSDIYIDDLDNITPQELKTIINLNILSFIDENIDDLTPVSQLKNLVMIDFSKNMITDLSPLSELYNLGVIIGYENEITDLKCLQNLTNLEVMILSKNKISDVTILNLLTKIEYLDISYNQINETLNLNDLENLQFINFAYNPIQNIDNIINFNNLYKIICSDFDKNEINKTQKTLPKVEIINLDNGKSTIYLGLFSLIFSATIFSLGFL